MLLVRDDAVGTPVGQRLVFQLFCFSDLLTLSPHHRSWLLRLRDTSGQEPSSWSFRSELVCKYPRGYPQRNVLVGDA